MTDVVTEPGSKMLQATVGFERKLNLGARGLPEYENAVASIYLQFEVDPTIDSDNSISEKAKHYALLAKTAVFEQLGIPFTLSDGVAVELVQGVIPGSVVEQAPPAAVAPAQPVAALPVQPPAAGVPTHDCAKCGSSEGYWDNRPKKASKQFSANSPDFKCRNKACGAGIWLTPKGA